MKSSSENIESDIAQITRGLGSAEIRPKTLMEDFAALEKLVMNLGNQVADFKRRVQNLVGTP